MKKGPLRFTFIFLGKTKKSYLTDAIDDFKKRLGHYVAVSVKTIKEKSFSTKVPIKKVMDEEAKQILAHVSPQDYVVTLDSRGKQYSSEKLAVLLEEWQGQGKHQVTVIIGGSNGLAQTVLDRSHLVLSLSKMTFTHDMARFIILEQFYRAFTILGRTGYHK